MLSLPLLISDDMAALDAALGELVSETGARLALFTDRSGFIVTQQGDAANLDIVTLGALAANSFAATEAIALMIDKKGVTSLYQEGESNSLLILTVGESGFLGVLFPSEIGVGSVKFYSQGTLGRIANQLEAAKARMPVNGLPEVHNLIQAGPLFRRRATT